MHIPDGFLDVKTLVASGALAAGLGLAVHHAQKTLPQKRVPLMGLAGAFIFAGQMLNFPIPGATSGHLMGGVLAAVLLGPSAAVIVLAAVLIVQCFMFADGGVLALGANVFNLAVVHPLVGYAIYCPIQRMARGNAGQLMAAAFAAWLSTVITAMVCAGQLAMSGKALAAVVFPAMAGVHMIIGVGEAMITASALALVLRTRPELLIHHHPRVLPAAGPHARVASARSGVLHFISMGLLLAIGLAVFIAPFASEFPDGLEKVAQVLGFEHAAGENPISAPAPDYQVPGIRSMVLATAIAGAVGTLLMFGLSFAFGKALARKGADVEAVA